MVKRSLVAILRSPAMWRHLDNGRGFRDWAKAHRCYPPGVVHLVDQGAFDAVDTCIRHIEPVITSTRLKARIWRRFTDEHERH